MTLGNYYASLKRGGKQFRRSLKTSDCALAQGRLSALRDQVNNLTLTPELNATFADTADAAHGWIESQTHPPKPSSLFGLSQPDASPAAADPAELRSPSFLNALALALCSAPWSQLRGGFRCRDRPITLEVLRSFRSIGFNLSPSPAWLPNGAGCGAHLRSLPLAALFRRLFG